MNFAIKNEVKLKKNPDHQIIFKVIDKVKFKFIMNIKGHLLKVNIYDRFSK